MKIPDSAAQKNVSLAYLIEVLTRTPEVLLCFDEQQTNGRYRYELIDHYDEVKGLLLDELIRSQIRDKQIEEIIELCKEDVKLLVGNSKNAASQVLQVLERDETDGFISDLDRSLIRDKLVEEAVAFCKKDIIVFENRKCMASELLKILDRDKQAEKSFYDWDAEDAEDKQIVCHRYCSPKKEEAKEKERSFHDWEPSDSEGKSMYCTRCGVHVVFGNGPESDAAATQECIPKKEKKDGE